MAQGVTRWLGLTVLGCALVALALLPPAPPVWSAAPAYRSRASDRLVPQVQRAWVLSRTLALRDSLLRATASSWRPEEHLRVVVARHLPVSLRAAIDTTLAPARALLGAAGAGARVLVAAVEDTLAPPDLPGALPRGIELAYLLPQATDRRTCLVIATLGRDAIGTLRGGMTADSLLRRGLRSRWIDQGSLGELLGPCAFYGAFGSPGKGLAGWLQSTDYVPALDAAYFVGGAAPPPPPPEPVTSPAWWRQRWAMDLRPDLEACASGQPERCRRAVLAPSEPWSLWYAPQFRIGAELSVPGLPNLGRLGRAAIQALDVLEAEFLDDLLGEIGPQRFAVLWRSDEPLEQAFARVVGQPLGTWTMRWVQRRLGKAPRGPTVPLPAALWALALIGVAFAGGAAYAARRSRRTS
jgi:hypothetical protein